MSEQVSYKGRQCLFASSDECELLIIRSDFVPETSKRFLEQGELGEIVVCGERVRVICIHEVQLNLVAVA